MENFLVSEHTTSRYLVTPSFSGHQTFPFRYTWLKKGVDAVTENPAVFSSENASVTLGVGKNMVASIKHWCQVSELIKADTRQRGRFDTTPLGEAIFNNDNGFDPYLDDPATLWLIHWENSNSYKSSNRRGIGHLTFSEKINSHPTYLKNNCPNGHNSRKPPCDPPLKVHSSGTSIALSEPTVNHVTPLRLLRRVLIAPLIELNLIIELPDGGGYEFQRGEKETLPTQIFAATLIAFWAARFSEKYALPFSELMYAPLSPGRTFRLDEGHNDLLS